MSQLSTINDKEQIEKLLNYLAKMHNIVHLRSRLVEYLGYIKELYFDEFIFDTDYKIQKVEKNVRIIFNYMGQFYYFNTDIVNYEDDKYTLKIPKEVYIHVKRRYNRYKITHQNISCDLKLIMSHLDQKVYQQMLYSVIEIKYIHDELKKEEPDINNIIKLVFQNNQDLCDQIRLFLPADSLPNKIIYNFLQLYRKPFLVNDTQDEKDYFTNEFPSHVTTYLDYMKQLQKLHRSSLEVNNILKELMHYYQKNSIYSVLYIPVFVINQLVGVLKISNLFKSQKKFDLDMINHFLSIGRVIAEIIIKNKLNCIKDEDLSITIKDISLSGIGIEVFESTCMKYLNINNRLKVNLKLDNKEWLFFTGIIKRIERLKDKFKLGIEIEEILPVNRVKLMNFLNNTFGKSY